MLQNRFCSRPRPRLLLALPLLLTLGGPLAAQPLRMAAHAFDERIEIEVRDLLKADAKVAIEEAVREILAIETLTSPDGAEEGGLGALNRAAGGGEVAVDPRLLQLLARAQDFCIWSRGAHGPLGGSLYALWGLRRPVTGRPADRVLAEATTATSCDGLRLDPAADKAALVAGARAELWSFAEGFAVDRAAGVLRAQGSGDFWIQIGRTYFGVGLGPEGGGWRAKLPGVEEGETPFEAVVLDGKALAAARFDERSLAIAGDHVSPFVDQRNGQPSKGVEAVLVVTDLAVDARSLAASLMVLGHREGTMRLGDLKPQPAALWLLGDGSGMPLLSTYRWAQLKAR